MGDAILIDSYFNVNSTKIRQLKFNHFNWVECRPPCTSPIFYSLCVFSLALAAAKATMELPDAQLKMMKITDAAKKKVLNDYKDAIDKAAADAARKAIDDALNQYTAKK